MRFACLVVLALLAACQPQSIQTSGDKEPKPNVVIMVSANAEWEVVRALYPNAQLLSSPCGEYFWQTWHGQQVPVFHGGWGKIAAASATQYVIDRWQPRVMLNLGTCGGFAGKIKRGDVVLANRTVVYDILEQMGDSKAAIADYTTQLDLAWLGDSLPVTVQRTVLISADRDLVPTEIAQLGSTYQAVAGDWESGAIAYTASRNHCKVVILRGVTDLVSSASGEAYGNEAVFTQGTQRVMRNLFSSLPAWLLLIEKKVTLIV